MIRKEKDIFRLYLIRKYYLHVVNISAEKRSYARRILIPLFLVIRIWYWQRSWTFLFDRNENHNILKKWNVYAQYIKRFHWNAKYESKPNIKGCLLTSSIRRPASFSWNNKYLRNNTFSIKMIIYKSWFNTT